MPVHDHPDELSRFLAFLTSSPVARREADKITHPDELPTFMLRNGFDIDKIDITAAFSAMEHILYFYEF